MWGRGRGIGANRQVASPSFAFAARVKGTSISDRVRVSVGATVAIEHLGLKQQVLWPAGLFSCVCSRSIDTEETALPRFAHVVCVVVGQWQGQGWPSLGRTWV